MRAVATMRRGRILVWTPQPFRLGEVLPGAYWRPQDKVWSAGLNMDTARALREVFGDSLEIRPELWAWAAEQAAREKAMGELGKSATASTPRVDALYPILSQAMKSRPYQTVGVRFIADAKTSVLADEVGLGKTLEIIGGVLESGVAGPYLIIAPQTAAYNVWPAEMKDWAPDQPVFVAKGDAARRAKIIEQAKEQSGWLIINKEMLTTKVTWVCPACSGEWPASDKPKSAVVDCGHNPQRVRVVKTHRFPGLFNVAWGAIIIDEAHEVVIRRGARANLIRTGVRLLESAEGGLRVLASATITAGRPERMFGSINWLRPKEYGSFWSWVNLHFNTRQASIYGGTTITGIKEDAQSLYRALDGVLLRRTRKEVRPDLPPKQRIPVMLEMTPEQATAYRQMVQEARAELAQGDVTAVGHLAIRTRLAQFATAYGERVDGKFIPALPSAKYDWLVEFLKEANIIDPDPNEEIGKVVIVSQFTKILRLFAEQLMTDYGLEVVGITGSVKGSDRDAAIKTFNNPNSGVQLMFLQTKSGGAAITLDAADDMVFLDEAAKPHYQEQAEGRIDNRRPEEKVAQRRYWYLRSKGTIEESIAARNAGDEKDVRNLMDGRRGVEILIEMLGDFE